MAFYGNKYIGRIEQRDGSYMAVVIAEKNYSGAVYNIAHMTGLSLEVGGGSDPVYTPVLKTTLRFSMKDAWDIGNAQAITGDTKHGRWEEFYTEDATKYQVTLYIEDDEGGAIPIWTGYITPDSWEEDLYYHGEITITARDMLGTLSDADFDAAGTNGLMTVRELIGRACVKAQVAMNCSFLEQNVLRNTAAGTSILDARISVAAFEGRSWWAALTETMESLGLVMRYDGNNGLYVCSLRYLSAIAGGEEHGCEFLNHTGLRQLDPPVKEISATYNVEHGEVPMASPAVADYSSFGQISFIYVYGLSTVQGTAPASGLSRASGDWSQLSGSATRPPLFEYPYQPLEDFDLSESPYFICNTGQVNIIGYQWNYGQAKISAGRFKTPCRLRIVLDGPLVETSLNGFRLAKTIGSDIPQLESVRVYITDANGKYYDGQGGWVTGTEKTSSNDSTSGALDPLEISFNGDEAFLDIIPSSGSAAGDITVNIVHVKLKDTLSSFASNAIAAPLRVSIAEPSSIDLADEYAVRTEYNEDYNVRIERTPSVVSTDTSLPGSLLRNVLKDAYGAPLADLWNWTASGTGYPLEVMIQAQLVQYYAAPMSIFTGLLHDTDAQGLASLPGFLYSYTDRPCLLMRGVFDFVTGFVSDAALREYQEWSDVWGTFAPVYTVAARHISSGGSGGSSAPGGGGGSGGGTVVEWGETVGTGYQQLKVGGDTTHIVALQGHKHVIADITDLAALIPSQAGANNQLADKNFVNSSIATSTAEFRGTSPGGLTEQEFLEWADALTHDLNDYCYWLTSDAAGNTLYKRYKYDGTQWLFEYALNNSSFTAAQWAAINSGITASLTNKLAYPDTVLNEQSAGSSALVTAGAIWAKIVELLSAIAAKAAAAWGAITNNKAPLTVNDTTRTVLLEGWHPGSAGGKGLPVFTAPRTETETYQYAHGTGSLSPVSVSVNAGQPRVINHLAMLPGDETNPFVIEGLVNDLAYLLNRGGSCKIYVDNTERTDAAYGYDKAAMFDLSAQRCWFTGTYNGNSRELPSTSSVVKLVVDLTGVEDIRLLQSVVSGVNRYTTKLGYGSTLYLNFNGWGYGPRYCNVTVRYGYYTISNGVITAVEDTSCRESIRFTGQNVGGTIQLIDYLVMTISGGDPGYGILSIELELSGYSNTRPMFTEIGLYNSFSEGAAEVLMPRAKDVPVLRNITPFKSDTYDLGAAATRWRYLHVKRVYLSETSYLEADSNGKVHLYGAPGMVIENGDIASAGSQS